MKTIVTIMLKLEGDLDTHTSIAPHSALADRESTSIRSLQALQIYRRIAASHLELTFFMATRTSQNLNLRRILEIHQAGKDNSFSW